jgi:hypothetical protein
VRRIATLAFVLAAAVGVPARAGAQPLGGPSSPLAACLADHSTGKDRKDLARWMFSAMSQHPAIADLSAATPALREEVNRTVGAMVTRMLTVDCVKEAKAAVSGADSKLVFEQAFGQLGQLAMQEIMTDPNVARGLQDLPKYMDRKKFEDAFKDK